MYSMNLRKREDTGNWKGSTREQSGELALVEAMDVSQDRVGNE
jgi:hypothetical protein